MTFAVYNSPTGTGVVVEVRLSAAAIVTCGVLGGTLVVVVDIALVGSFVFCCDDFLSASEEQGHKKHTCGVQRYAMTIVRKR